jgi:hypothetical protein
MLTIPLVEARVPRSRAGVGAAGVTEVCTLEYAVPLITVNPMYSGLNLQLPYNELEKLPKVPVIKSVPQSILAAPTSSEVKSVPAHSKAQEKLLDKRVKVFTLLLAIGDWRLHPKFLLMLGQS